MQLSDISKKTISKMHLKVENYHIWINQRSAHKSFAPELAGNFFSAGLKACFNQLHDKRRDTNAVNILQIVYSLARLCLYAGFG